MSKPSVLANKNLELVTGRVLTSSELKTFQRCKRKWWLGDVRKLRKKTYEGSAPLTIGTLVHSGLEAFYRPTDITPPVTAVHNKAQRMIERYPDAAGEILEAADLAKIMLDGYLDWIEEEGADADLEVYAAEEKVEVPVGPFTLRGKMDARAVRRSDNTRVQIENKSVGNLADVPKTAQMNPQFLTYDLLSVLSKGVGERTDGIILNMLRKVKRSKSAKPPFYGRHEVRHNLDELRNHYRHIVGLGHEMERIEGLLGQGWLHHSVVPPSPTRDCSWDCKFYEVCPLFDDGSDVEGMLTAGFEEYDPLERYEDEEEI